MCDVTKSVIKHTHVDTVTIIDQRACSVWLSFFTLERQHIKTYTWNIKYKSDVV